MKIPAKRMLKKLNTRKRQPWAKLFSNMMPKHIIHKALWIMLFSIKVFSYADSTETTEEADEIKYIISLDTNFTIAALRNYGYGIGVNYERKITDFFSVKPGFGHSVYFADMITVTVNLQLFFYYYPLSSGLDKLYVGIGNGADFIMYNEDIEQDTAIWLTPMAGWKWKILPYLVIEPFVGWKFFIDKTENYENVDKYLDEGFQWGLSFILFIKNVKKKE